MSKPIRPVIALGLALVIAGGLRAANIGGQQDQAAPRQPLAPQLQQPAQPSPPAPSSSSSCQPVAPQLQQPTRPAGAAAPASPLPPTATTPAPPPVSPPAAPPTAPRFFVGPPVAPLQCGGQWLYDPITGALAWVAPPTPVYPPVYYPYGVYLYPSWVGSGPWTFTPVPGYDQTITGMLFAQPQIKQTFPPGVGAQFPWLPPRPARPAREPRR